MSLFFLMLFFFSCASFSQEINEIKIAIIGDSGAKKGFGDVLNLIKNQKADLVLHAGDLAYDELNLDAPQKWNEYIDEILGENFPYFFVVGNHDVVNWFRYKGYHAILEDRIKKAKLKCQAIDEKDMYLGIKSYCKIQDLLVIGSGVGTMGDDHNSYIKKILKENINTPWKICLWHKNQHDMQTGTKADEVGWEVYQSCQKYGAMILTAHEHAYSRTYTLTDLGNKKQNHGRVGEPDNIILGKDSTFVALSGLGGHSTREFSCSLHQNNNWWASIAAANYQKFNNKDIYGPFCADNNNNLEIRGVLFITLNYNNLSNKAYGEFINIKNQVLDNFVITRN